MSDKQQMVSPVPFFDLTRQYAAMKEEIIPVVESVLSTQQFILGESVRRFEDRMAAFWKMPHAVGVASGTDALILSLRAAGLTEGETVLVPSFTFYASVSSIVLAGGLPLFTEVNPESFVMTVSDLARILDERGERRGREWYDKLTGSPIRGIVVVHLYGQMANMAELASFAKTQGLWIVEDACQAIGALDHGTPPGTHSVAAAYSFFPTKNLGGGGDGGMIATTREDVDRHLRSLRVHGSTRRYYHDELGYNSRLDSLQATILNVKLDHLPAWNRKRENFADEYVRTLKDCPGLLLPQVSPESTHVFHQFTIQLTGPGSRDRLKESLSRKGVGSEIYYPLPQHRQPAFSHLPEQHLPVTDLLSDQVLSLPVFPELTEGEQDRVITAIREEYATP